MGIVRLREPHPPHPPSPASLGEGGWGGWGSHGEASAIGTHLLLDFYEVPPAHLTDAERLSQALTDAAHAANMTPLSAPVLHRFPGGGLTGFLPLAESHIAFHSYPEYGYLAADVFTCGDDPAAPDRAVALLTNALIPGRATVRRLARGEDIDNL
jgi:S-adenosylmethionine decarboxylase